MSRDATTTALSASLVALPEVSAAVLFGLHEVFSSVGTAWEQLTGERVATRCIEPRIVAESRGPFASAFGPPLSPDAVFAEVSRTDLVLVADLALDPAVDPRGQWPAATAWIREQYARGATVCSVCTGSVLLAEAGLLDGLEATSHWSAVPHFERYYPTVRITPEKVLVPAGPEHRIVTGGGSASWTDLALYLIARFCGRDEAVRTAKLFLFGDRSDGQLPFAAMLRLPRHSDAVIEHCQAWIASECQVVTPVARMVERSGLAPRTFKRRFRAATGYTPIEYVQTLRIEEAKHLLESTEVAIDDIGEQVGYQDPASFRRIFKRMTGITPARYRQRFAGLGLRIECVEALRASKRKTS
jgi:transcriptional regulator GlxA family with amidase domain